MVSKLRGRKECDMTHLKNRSVFRIYTEDKNRDRTVKLVGEYFINFSVFYGQCVWHGKQESTVVFEIVDDFTSNGNTINKMVIELVKDIRKLNKQSDVLVTESQANITFVTGEGD